MGRAKPLAFNVEPRAPLREGVGGAWGAAHGLVRPRPGKKHESLPLETRREHVRRQSAVNRQRLGDVLASCVRSGAVHALIRARTQPRDPSAAKLPAALARRAWTRRGRLRARRRRTWARNLFAAAKVRRLIAEATAGSAGASRDRGRRIQLGTVLRRSNRAPFAAGSRGTERRGSAAAAPADAPLHTTRRRRGPAQRRDRRRDHGRKQRPARLH